MPGAYLWGWEGTKWVKLKVDADGSIHIVGYVDNLDDIGNVNAPTPGAGEVLIWVDPPGEWQSGAAAVGAHAATHQNGGADEISVAALSGQLADDQPPKAHLLGGAKHTADSLADLNALIDDATLDDSGDPRDPNAHKNSHDPQDGADPLDTAIAVKVGEANAIGVSHSLARADHVHEKHHAKYTDADAIDAMGAIADDNPLHHDRAEEWGATEHTAIGDAAPHHAKYTDAEAVDAIEADDNLPLASITFIIDGGGEVITTGQKGHLRIPFACTINRVTMLADVAGAIVVDIWKCLYVGFPPDDGDSITASAPPTIVATNQKSTDSTLTGWTTAIVAGAILAYNVDSCATIKRVTISLKVTKT